MSMKRPKRLSSKKKRPPNGSPQAEILHKLGLETYRTQPLDPSSMLDISTWAMENPAPLELKDLPNAFLRRLWMLSKDARNPCCQPQHDSFINDNNLPEEKPDGPEGKSQSAINPLDLVTSVFIAANTFLQQEMSVRMSQCKFAVPLVLPNVDPEEPSQFLLWPSRGVMGQWKSHSLETDMKVQEWNLASASMPIVSCVKLGCCSISKSQVLNYVLNGSESCFETFVHRGMDGGQLPRRLSHGLVEIGWYLPIGDVRDIHPVPLVISNLRGDASTHEKCLKLLCQMSSAVIIFYGDCTEKGKQLLLSCKDMESKLILVDLSDTEDSTVGSVGQSLEQQTRLPKVSVLSGANLSEEEVANKLSEILKNWLPYRLKLVTLEAAAKSALEIGLHVDEGPVCKKAMASVEEVLKGLYEGSTEFRVKQLPLQGSLWSKLAEIDREESKQRIGKKEIDPQLQKQKKAILTELSSYKMTTAMKHFTNALCTTNKMERTYFLIWLKLKLHLMQTEKQKSLHVSFANLETEDLEHEASSSEWDSDSFCSVSIFGEENEVQPVNTEPQVSEQHCEIAQEDILQSTETNTECQSQQSDHLEQVTVQEAHVEDENSLHVPEDQRYNLDSVESATASCKEKHSDQLELDVSDSSSPTKTQVGHEKLFENQLPSCSQPFEPKSFTLGLEHFLREMGLIFELTHSRGSQNVLRLHSLATDLLLYGVPLELMDGDASNVPLCWLGCVFAELKRRLNLKQFRTRVLTSLGDYHARNAEVLSALFGVKFPDRRTRTNRGVYMVALVLPDYIRKETECDFLLLIDVEGICSVSADKTNMLLCDDIMATFATGLSDVLLQNISPLGENEFETTLTVTVNALLRTKECASLPICQLLIQDDGINSILHASQLRHLSKILQTDDKGNMNQAKSTSCVTCIKGPWSNMQLSEPVDTHYSKAVLKLKKDLIEALKRCAAKSKTPNLMEVLGRLCGVWDAVKSESFSIGLQNTNVALAFSVLCTKFSHWEDCILQNMENWLMGATKTISAMTNAFDTTVQKDLMNDLKNEAQEEVKSEINEVKSKLEAYLMKDEILKANSEALRPIIMSNISNLQDRVMDEIVQKLETFNESNCFVTQMNKFETLLAKEQQFKLLALVETSKSTKILLQDSELEEEFETVWKRTLSNFDFRSSVTDNITSRVTEVLRQNIISRGLQKHMQKLDVCDQNQTSGFQVHDEHFGYRSRLKHMFEDNNRQQRLEAQQVACKIIEECNQFVADKCSLPADFSDSYIVELLENVENTLREKSMEIKSAFEVDLKVYICNAACQDFQKLHDRYAKDGELLTCISASKTKYIAQFIYKFRKKDQCQRMAQTFISMVIKPTVADYISRSMAREIAEEIKDRAKEYESPHAFQKSLLEELIKEDQFESYVECLLFYDDFRLRKIQETVDDHLSESTSLNKWRLQKLGEIVGKVAAAVSQTTEATKGVLSDAKPLLERVCLILEKDVDVNVNKAYLNGPLFSITTEWDFFVKRLMELLSTMQLDLSQEFSQNVDVSQLLSSLPVQSQEHLLNKVRGCEKRCPLCKAPCEEEELGHEVHKSLLHRPKGMLPYGSCALHCISCPESTDPEYNKQIHEELITCKNLTSLHPNWSNFSDDPNSQKANNYWRYVLVRFNERFAAKFKQKPAKIPEEWRKITQEEALQSLNKVFPNKDCC
ncbi:interferon-induced very large GTPase 1 [Kryptolebias marmoratus]|uniref:GTPase, very large interferon inducible 1-like 2 n=1 Tax=Kryptolebias marmoratus TaxID=37003 RepID=A0A3Q3AJN7_KRYMA|nr:interferon-induced very large GTPase 1 [Kryptolebias marmoratus]